MKKIFQIISAIDEAVIIEAPELTAEELKTIISEYIKLIKRNGGEVEVQERLYRDNAYSLLEYMRRELHLQIRRLEPIEILYDTIDNNYDTINNKREEDNNE